MTFFEPDAAVEILRGDSLSKWVPGRVAGVTHDYDQMTGLVSTYQVRCSNGLTYKTSVYQIRRPKGGV